MSKSALPIRSALETLQLEFPEYRVYQRVIGDRLFSVAEAADPGVQPVFAQAETVDRLRAKLRIPEADINAEVPSIARIYDFLLGGKNNFDADRKQADRVLEVYPHAAELAVQARQFQARAITYAAQQGIRQFLDVGCGLPTAPNTHETAQAISPDARVVYADNDAQVLSHARNLLAKAPGVRDFDRSEGDRFVQQIDKASGLPLWTVEVIDADPAARSRTVKVKIAADHLPVLPPAPAGMPFVPVEFTGLTVTPYVNQAGRLAYSPKATGVRAPGRHGGRPMGDGKEAAA